MSNPKSKLATEAAALARVIGHLEGVVAETKARYWAKLEELHSLDDEGPDAVAEAAAFARWRAGHEGETLAEMSERYKADGKYPLAKGAVTCDDT